MTLSDLQSHSIIASDLSCFCAAIDNISTDITRRAVSLR